jgi:hypothetical protein
MTLADYKMAPWTRRVMASLVPVICTDEVVTRGLVDAVLDHVELTMRSFPAFLRFSLVMGTLFFEWFAIVLPSSHLHRFSGLPREKQNRYFRMFWDSKFQLFRQLAKGIKAPIALGYWELPAVWEQMGYTPAKWIAEVGARRQRDYAADIAAQEAMVVAPDPLVRRPADGKVHHG